MPTDDERREIAARLLKYEPKSCLRGALGWCLVCGHYDCCEDCRRDAARLLADLIEPKPERTCHMEPSFVEPSILNFMQEYLCLSCKEYSYMQIAVDGDRLNYCPSCGAKVVEE